MVSETNFGARYLLSDLLHNSSSSAKNAWSLRAGFEKFLPEICEANQLAGASALGAVFR